MWFQNEVNNNNNSLSAKLIDDIDLQNSKSFFGIGMPLLSYSGLFDGNGHKIKNINIEYDSNDVGFIAFASSADINNLTIESGTIKGKNNVGGIIGKADFGVRISNCTNKAKIIGKDYVGGIAGNPGQHSSIYQCANSGKIEGENNFGDIFGS